MFDFVQYLSQEDLDLAFEKLGEQDKVMLDQLALEIVRKSKNSAAHVQFSTKMAFEFLAMVGIKMLATPPCLPKLESSIWRGVKKGGRRPPRPLRITLLERM